MPTFAFTFPGQGSQKAQMGAPWTDDAAFALVEQASDATGRDIGELLLRSDDETLRQTRNSQLATFMVSMIGNHALGDASDVATGFAGHSLGEYSALCASGVLSFDDAVRLVAARGEAMQAAADAEPGTMAAVLGLDDDAVDAACEPVEGCWVANYNAPGQVVIAGTADGVAAGSEAASGAGAKRVLPLPVGGAFHTPLMAPAQDRLNEAIGAVTFNASAHPVYANVDAQPHTSPAEWGELLSRQLISPVRWTQLVTTMVDDGYDTLVEIGAGSTLTGMAKRITKATTNMALETPADVATFAETAATSA